MDFSNRVVWVQLVGFLVLAASMFGVTVDSETQTQLVGGFSALGLVLTAIVAKWHVITASFKGNSASQGGFFTPRFAAVLFSVMLGSFALTMIHGCASFQQNAASEKPIVQYAVGKIIEQGKTPEDRVARAAKIREVATGGKSFFDTGTATLPMLELEIQKRLQPLNLSPSDRMLADALIATVVSELQARVGAAVSGATAGAIVPADAVYQVSTVLGWIIEATELY